MYQNHNQVSDFHFQDIINDEYDCQYSSQECPPLNNIECPIVEPMGMLVDYFDVTPYGGPHSLTISDEDGNRIEVSIWPESNQYQDGFDITLTELNKLITSPYGNYIIQVTGTVGVFCDDDIQLDIQTDWDVTVEYEYDIQILEEIGGYFIEDSSINSTSINPEPFVVIPSLGETLDFSYSHPANSRVIIRIFDLSGRLVTSLVDKYIEDAGIWYNGVNPVDPDDQSTWINSDRSSWNGRDHLGQIVSPGTYLIHVEAYNFSTGRTLKDILERFDLKNYKEPRSETDKKSVKVIKDYLKISCPIDKAPDTLNKFH